MYKVIGADGKEYGPVPTEQLRQWLREGRISFQTRVRPDGQAEWQVLGEVAEFAAERAALGTPPTPLPGGVVAPQTSGLAVASLVLGILGCFGITALAGLVLGVVSLVRVNNSQGRLSGKGIAIAGIAVSAFFLLLLPVWLAMSIPAFSKAKEKAQRVVCMNNEKQLCLAAIMYASSNNDQLPPAATWCDALQANLGSPQVFQCPSAPGARCAFGFNSKLGGKKLAEVAPQTVMFFEAPGGWNQSGGPEAALQAPPHDTFYNVGFVDGHVEAVQAARLRTLRWDP